MDKNHRKKANLDKSVLKVAQEAVLGRDRKRISPVRDG
jgi:hypothetical protein